MVARHYPVMVREALEELAPPDNGVVVDATFGGGGHSRAILEALGSGGRLIGVDRDPSAAERAAVLARVDSRFSFWNGPFDEVLQELAEEGVRADGVLFDLGLSSYQIDEAERGFTYVREGPLDMRMDPAEGASAAEFLNSAGAEELVMVLVEHGGVSRREARRVTDAVIERRPLWTTTDLAGAVRAALGWVERGGNPAKRVFQAVRIHVNDELGRLRRGLEATERLLVPGGRLVVISFHSGEDRIVKQFISGRSGRCVCPPELPVCTCGARPIFKKGAITKPSAQEAAENPRSASARLRVAVRTNDPAGGPSEEHSL